MTLPLILFALLAHYDYGKRMGAPYFVTRILAGVTLTALPIATLILFNWQLPIRFVALSMVGIGAILSARTLWRERRELPWRKLAILGVIGAGILAFNFPEKVFVVTTETGEERVLTNPDLAVRASQTRDFLNHDYGGIKPSPLTVFHLATQVVALSLSPNLGLMDFQMAVAVYLVLILVSFGEAWFSSKLVLIASFATVFTFFAPSLGANLSGPGAFPAFALFHLLTSAFASRIPQALLFLILLSSSLFPALPILPVLLLALLFIHRRDFGFQELKRFFRRPMIILLGVLTLAFALSAAVIAFQTLGRENERIFHHGSHYLLSLYGLFGWIENALHGKTWFELFNHSWSHHFRGGLDSLGIQESLGIGVFALALTVLVIWIKRLRRRTQPLAAIESFMAIAMALMAFSILFEFPPLPMLPAGLTPLVMGYVVIGGTLIAWHDGLESRNLRFYIALCSLLYLFQFRGPLAVKSPVAVVGFDISLLVVFSYWLSKIRSKGWRVAAAAIVTVLFLVIFEPRYQAFLRLPDIEANYQLQSRDL